jgi:hypothetical protein
LIEFDVSNSNVDADATGRRPPAAMSMMKLAGGKSKSPKYLFQFQVLISKFVKYLYEFREGKKIAGRIV